MAQRITITIPRDHAKGTTISVNGHAGPGCRKLTEALEKALGKTQKDEMTNEFNHVPQRQQQHELQ